MTNEIQKELPNLTASELLSEVPVENGGLGKSLFDINSEDEKNEIKNTTKEHVVNSSMSIKPVSKEISDIKNSIFQNGKNKLKTKIITFFGVEIEVRQQTVGSISQLLGSDDSSASKIDALVDTVIISCYKPGTNEQVFNLSDVEDLRNLPYGKDYERVQKTILELSQMEDISKSEKN